MDVILHIGAHRCGSTTFQQFLQRNEARLGAAGLRSWTPDRTRSGLFSGLIQRPDDLSPQAEAKARRSSGVIRIELDRLQRAGCRALIVSEENLIGAVRDNLRWGALYPTIEGRMLRLRPAFADQVTRIGLSIRSLDSLWASSVSYGVAQGHRVPSAAKLEAIVAQPRRWRDVVADLARAFPGVDIVVWPFERFAGQPETQLSILTGGRFRLAGLTGLRDWHNPGPRLSKLRRILALRGDLAMSARLPEGDGRWTPFDDGQRERLRQAYLEDLAWFATGADGLARFAEGPPGGAPSAAPSHHELPERQRYQISGFAATPPAWVPPEGGQDIGKQGLMV